jgi:Zn-finger protein
MVKRLNKACKFYPCHQKLEDCTFCYCPFYPCLDKNLGCYIYSGKGKKNIWSCQDCPWIHKKTTVDNIFRLIRLNHGKLKPDHQKLRTKETGIVILGHGSKLQKTKNTIDKTIKIIKSKFELTNILPAYLQLCQPSLDESIKNLVIKGCQRIIISPFFLFEGNHVTRDIPEVIKQEVNRYPKVNFIYTKNLGHDARITEVVLDRIREAIE